MPGKRTPPKKIILHACCAPCASSVIERLVENGYWPLIFFFNPNIYPFCEYEIRRDELREYCYQIKVDFIEGDYQDTGWQEEVGPYALLPEGSRRCCQCFGFRLDRTAAMAKELNVTYFTTTLTVSPHKETTAVFRVGGEAANKYGPEFLAMDFKKKDGFKRSVEISRQQGFYRQNYCGCKYSRG